MKQRHSFGRHNTAKVGPCLLVMSCLSAYAQNAGSYGCRYSARAISLNSASEHPISVISPDRQKTVTTRSKYEKTSDDDHVTYRVRIARKTFRARLPGFNGLWSPDSKAFAVNQTEGGGGIGARVYVFYADASGLQKMDVSKPIETDFGNPVPCDLKIAPNTGFISWGPDSSTLYVAAEVIPVSLCKCMGAFRVYEISLPSLTFVRTYSQRESRKRFQGLLGCELRDAPDSCVKLLERHFQKSDIRPTLDESR